MWLNYPHQASINAAISLALCKTIQHEVAQRHIAFNADHNCCVPAQ